MVHQNSELIVLLLLLSPSLEQVRDLRRGVGSMLAQSELHHKCAGHVCAQGYTRQDMVAQQSLMLMPTHLNGWTRTHACAHVQEHLLARRPHQHAHVCARTHAHRLGYMRSSWSAPPPQSFFGCSTPRLRSVHRCWGACGIHLWACARSKRHSAASSALLVHPPGHRLSSAGRGLCACS